MLGLMLKMTVRSLRRRIRRTAMTFAGVAFATASLVVLASIMVAVGDTMIRNSAALHSGHICVTWPNGEGLSESQLSQVRAMPHVRSALPRKTRSGQLQRFDRTVGLVLFAAEPQAERAQSVLPARTRDGQFLGAPREIAIGTATAETLGLRVGDAVQFTPASGTAMPFRVGAIFATTVDRLDQGSAWVQFDDLEGPADELAIYLDSPDATQATADAVRGLLSPSAKVQSWRQTMPELVQLIDLDEISMNVVLVLSLLILAFGVSNTAYMSVGERTREMGILKAVGVRPFEVGSVVLAETVAMVTLAGAAGVLLGTAAVHVGSITGLDLSRWTSSNPNFLVSGVIYPRATPYVLALPGLVAVACGLLAGLGPSWRAGRINVIQALRWI